jgi:hypothetical protein
VNKRRYLGVALAYTSAINPEPGIKRAPTAEEQARALANAAARQGGMLLERVATARQNEGLDHGVLRLIDSEKAEALIILTIDALRCDNKIDADLLRKLWQRTGRIDLLIEDVRLTDEASFRNYLDMVAAMNEVRERDASEEWNEVISSWDKQ